MTDPMEIAEKPFAGVAAEAASPDAAMAARARAVNRGGNVRPAVPATRRAGSRGRRPVPHTPLVLHPAATAEPQWTRDPDLDDLPAASPGAGTLPPPVPTDPPEPVPSDPPPPTPGEPPPVPVPTDPPPGQAPSGSPDPFELRPGPDPAWD